MQKDYLRKKIEELRLRKEAVQEKVKQKEQEIQKHFYLDKIRCQNSVISQRDALIFQNFNNSYPFHNDASTASITNTGVVSNCLHSNSLFTSWNSAEKKKELITSGIHAQRTRNSSSNEGLSSSSSGSRTNTKSCSRLIHRELEQFADSTRKSSMSNSLVTTSHSNSIASSFFRASSLDFHTSPGEEIFSKDPLRSLSPIQCSRRNAASEFSSPLDKEEFSSPSRIDLGIALEKAGFRMNLHEKELHDRKTTIRRVRFISPSFSRSASATENEGTHHSAPSVFSCLDSPLNSSRRSAVGNTCRCEDVQQDGKKDYAHEEKILKEKVGLVMKTIEACRASIEGAGSHFSSLSSTISTSSSSRVSKSFFASDHPSASSSANPVFSLSQVPDYGRKTITPMSGELATTHHKTVVHEEEGGSNGEEEDGAHPHHASFCAVWKSSNINSMEQGDNERRCLHLLPPHKSALAMSAPIRKRLRTPVRSVKPNTEKALVKNTRIPKSSALVTTLSSSPVASIIRSPSLGPCNEKCVVGLVNRRSTERYRKVFLAKSLRMLSKKEKSRMNKSLEEVEHRYSNASKTLVSSPPTSRRRFSVSAAGTEKEGILPGIMLPCGSTVYFE